ncbi:ABC transporter permease subunit [Mycoplasma sp. 4044]
MYKIWKSILQRKNRQHYFWNFVTKIALSLIILFLINIIIYTLTTAFHPVPLDIEKMSMAPDQTGYERLLEIYQLDKPLAQKVFQYIGRLFTFNFLNFQVLDQSIGVFDQENLQLSNYWITQNRYSYTIGLISLLISLIIGYCLGSLAAYKRNKATDYLINFGVIIFISISLLILIPIINLLFSETSMIIDFDVHKFSTYLLPILSLSLISMSSIVQVTRSETIKVLNSSYYLHATTLGMNGWQKYWKVVIKNSISPVLTLIPFEILSLFIASIFLESYYAVPGTWKYLYSVIATYHNEALCYLVAFLSVTYLSSLLITETIKLSINPFAKD